MLGQKHWLNFFGLRYAWSVSTYCIEPLRMKTHMLEFLKHIYPMGGWRIFMNYITTHHFDRGKWRLPHGYSLDYEIWTLNMIYKYILNTTTITCTRWVRALGISRPVSTKSSLKRDDSKTEMSFFSKEYIQMFRIRNMSIP